MHLVCESDSEEELKFHSEELSSASKSSETENSESSEDIENEEYKDEQISKSNRGKSVDYKYQTLYLNIYTIIFL